MRFHAPGFALIALLISAGCHRRSEPASAPGEAVLRISQRNEPDELDPALAALPDDFFIIRALSEGLVSPAMQGANRRPRLPSAGKSRPMAASGLFTCEPARSGRTASR